MTNNDNPRFNINYLKFAVYVANDLGIQPIPFLFGKLKKDEARLTIKNGIERIIISDKHVNNEIEVYKCLAHEMRHLYQFECCRQDKDPIGLLNVWKENINNINKTRKTFITYVCSPVEVDAVSYEYYIVNKYLNTNLTSKNKTLNKVYKAYAKKYFGLV